MKTYHLPILILAALACVALSDPPAVSRSVTISSIPSDDAPIPIAGTVKASWEAAQPVKLIDANGNALPFVDGRIEVNAVMQGDSTDAPPTRRTATFTGNDLNVSVSNMPIRIPRVVNAVMGNAAANLFLGESKTIEHLSFQISGPFEGTLRFEACNSTGGAWSPVAFENGDGSGKATTVSAPGYYYGSAVGRYHRVVWADYTSGSPTIYSYARPH